MPLCPDGHSSATSDYCDQCGAKLETDPAAAGSAGAPAEAAPSPASQPAGTAAAACPNCESPTVPDDKFCEVCGYDFAAGTLPAAPVPEPAPPTTPAPAPAISGPAWEAVVTADRDYYERTSPDEVTFPADCPERVFTVVEDEVLIGRRSDSRGVYPQIDLSGTPEDSAVSRRHAVLRRQPDGSWTLADAGSTNGTHLNDDRTPLAVGTAVPAKDGDRIYVGAWTRITLRAPVASAAGQ